MIERLARLGYASIGIVYMIVGVLAALAGMGRGGSTAGQHNAFVLILRQPFGIVALGVIAVGLIGYTVWRLALGGSLVMAALKNNPAAARGTSGALRALPEPLLVVVGIGLAAYGVYALVNARYRRITT